MDRAFTSSADSGEEDCIYCGLNVRPRQEAITCDTCERWQHRTCNTGIARNKYRRVVKGLDVLSWNCVECRGIQDSSNQDHGLNTKKRSACYMMADSDNYHKIIPFKKRKFSGDIHLTSAKMSTLTLSSETSMSENCYTRWSFSSGETTLDSQFMERFWHREMADLGVRPLTETLGVSFLTETYNERPLTEPRGVRPRTEPFTMPGNQDADLCGVEVEGRTFVFDELDSTEYDDDLFQSRDKRVMSILDYERRLAESRPLFKEMKINCDENSIHHIDNA